MGQQGETKGGKIHAKQQEKPPGTVQCSDAERDISATMETFKNIRKLLIFIYLCCVVSQGTDQRRWPLQLHIALSSIPMNTKHYHLRKASLYTVGLLHK